VQDPSYEPGPYSQFTETEVDNFASWYVQRMQAHGY
jgi:Rieske 2Fe-2S family protein